MHTSEKPYTWNQCSKASSQDGDLKNTYRWEAISLQAMSEEIFTKLTFKQTFENSHRWGILKAFSQDGSLKKHLITHTGVKPQKFNQCPKAFTVDKSLKIHLRMHTGEKP